MDPNIIVNGLEKRLKKKQVYSSLNWESEESEEKLGKAKSKMLDCFVELEWNEVE